MSKAIKSGYIAIAIAVIVVVLILYWENKDWVKYRSNKDLYTVKETEIIETNPVYEYAYVQYEYEGHIKEACIFYSFYDSVGSTVKVAVNEEGECLRLSLCMTTGAMEIFFMAGLMIHFSLRSIYKEKRGLV